MQKDLSRRALIGAGVALLAAGLAGCAKAVRVIRDTSAAVPVTVALSTTGASTGLSPAATVPRSSSAETSVTSRQPAGATSAVSGAGSPAIPWQPPSGSARPTLTTGSPTADAAVEIAFGPSTRRQVALTFHGAGDIRLARQVLSIARSKHAHITVMMVGTFLADNPSIGREILADGHELGNHTWSHQDINSMSENGMREEVIRCRDLLVQTTGTPGRYFRQSESPTAVRRLRRVAGAAGYAVCLSYSVDSMDWTDPGAEAVRGNVAAAIGGSIVSLHLGHQNTIDALPAILDDLDARGLTPVTVSTLLTARSGGAR